MRNKLLFFVISSIVLITAISQANELSVTKLPVDSYRLEKVELFNNQLISDLSMSDVDRWQTQPLSIALKYLNGASAGKFIQITQKIPKGENIEYPNTVIVTAIQDGYLDDSLRGEWVELTLKNNSKNIWLIKEAKRAFLCWRGENTKSFQRFCP